jgi:hypothetical protein
MILSTIADFLKNGSNMVKIRLQEISVPFQEKGYGMMMKEEATGGLYLFTHMILKETSILELGMMIRTVIVILLESIFCSTLRTQEYLLKEWLKLIKKEFLQIHRLDTTSSLTTCPQVRNSQSLILNNSIESFKWLLLPGI